MSNTNSRAYKVVFTDDTPDRVIKASNVMESGDRIAFYGDVAGYDKLQGSGDLIVSFLASEVREYSTVPVPEETVTGAHTYRITLAASSGGPGGVQEVYADAVRYVQGSEKNAGQFTFVTNLRGFNTSRTEFVISESNVFSIGRLAAFGEIVAVPRPSLKPTGADVKV